MNEYLFVCLDVRLATLLSLILSPASEQKEENIMSALGLGACASSQPVGSHRGHGFAFGHVNFQLPIHNMRVRPLTTRARALTPDRFRRDGNQHGNAEQGSRDRERDRDRGTGSTTARDALMGVVTVSNPTAQATAYRATPAGPQEAAEWSQALENVLNRLATVEAAQRKHVEALMTHDKHITENNNRCKWLHAHCKNMTDNYNNVVSEGFAARDPQLTELGRRVVATEEALEAVKNMTASAVAAINHMAGSVTAPPGISPPTVDMATPAHTTTTQQPNQAGQDGTSLPPVPGTPATAAESALNDAADESCV